MVNDSASPRTRRARYANVHDGVQVLVMNYEKLRVDFADLAAITKGARVLFVLDEAHKLINDGGHNQARKAFDKLVKDCDAIIWPMSATVVGGNPLRFRDVFSLDGAPRSNPLGTKAEFTAHYAARVHEIPIKQRNGARFNLIKYDWSLPRVQSIRHRIADRTMTIRKTDPGVREQFKGIDCVPEIIQPTKESQRLFDIITDHAKAAADREESLAPYYLLLRIAAINPEALRHSQGEVASEILDLLPANLLDAKHSPRSSV